MRRLPDSLDASVSAFRDMTAMASEGSSTRARVLARAERETRRRGLTKRGAGPLGIALVSLLSGAALAAAGYRWRAPAPIAIDDPDAPPAAAVAGARSPTRVVPAQREEAAGPPPSPDRAAAEASSYERAHRAHFFTDDSTRALAAWDAYLAAYPRGAFVPEARYNRALCLARLGRFSAGADALRPFATGRFGSYRQREACRLLRWLADQDARVDPGPSCADGG